MDTRYSEEDVVSHDHNAIPSTPVKTAAEILEKVGEVDVVGIDEAQFFDDEIVNVCDDDVLKVHAICIRCERNAYVSHRKVDVDGQVMLGEKMEYEPLCRECYRKEQARVKGYVSKLFE